MADEEDISHCIRVYNYIESMSDVHMHESAFGYRKRRRFSSRFLRHQSETQRRVDAFEGGFVRNEREHLTLRIGSRGGLAQV